MIRKTFTLVEVLVAMSVFLVGITPLIGVLASITVDHVEKRSANLCTDFIKHKVREFIDADEKISDIGPTAVPENKKIYYKIITNLIDNGIQEVIILVGTDPTLNPSHVDDKDFLDPPQKDERTLAEITFINTYSEYDL